MRPCPHCSREIKDAAELCKYCLRPVSPVNPGEPPVGESTPAMQARAARDAGARIFQIALPLSETTGFTAALGPAYTHTRDIQHASVLDGIEAEGWRLESAGYVYRVTGSISRDRFLGTGQREAVSGEIVGIYLFRRI